MTDLGLERPELGPGRPGPGLERPGSSYGMRGGGSDKWMEGNLEKIALCEIAPFRDPLETLCEPFEDPLMTLWSWTPLGALPYQLLLYYVNKKKTRTFLQDGEMAFKKCFD